MSYAIVINLDYESNPEEICHEIWREVKTRMVEAGFHIDNRVFIINRDQETACRLARQVIEGLEEHLEFHRKHIYRYLKDFYGYDMEHTTNLLVPSTSAIEVQGE